MREFTIVREVALSPDEAWKRLTDWPRHAERVPLTTIRRTDAGFVARTALGPIGFDDPMEIVEFDPPRRCRLVKRGRVVTGGAELSVEPTQHGSRVTWSEHLHVRGVPRLCAGVERQAGRILFARVLDDVLRTIEP